MPYDQGLWFIICSVVTGLGIIGAVFAFAKRGAATGFRVLGWALLPLAAALTGIVGLLWNFGTAIAGFVANFVFSLEVWIGVSLFALAFVLLGGSAFLRRRRGAVGEGASERQQATEGGSAATKDSAPAVGDQAQGSDDMSDFEDIEQILKNRGIS